MASKVKFSHWRTATAVIIDFLAQHRRSAILVLIFGIISAIGNGAVPYITGRLFDTIITPETINITGRAIPTYVVFILILVIIQLVVMAIEYRLTLLRSVISFHARFDYQSKSYAKLLELPLSFHKKRKIGEVHSKISNAGGGFELISDRVLGSLGPQFLTIFVAISFLISINPILALIATGMVLFYVSIAWLFIRDSADWQKKLIKGWGQSYGDTYDVINNAQTVKQAVTEDTEQKKINKRFVQNIFPHWFVMDKIWQSLDLVRGLVVIVLQVIVFAWSIRLVLAGSMTIGELIAFNSYLAMLFAPFTSLMQMWRMIQTGILDISAVEKILNTRSETYQPKNALKINDIRGDVEFKNVFFRYEAGKPVLEGISFSVQAGQVVALVGESGVGKSTLIDLLSGYYFAQKGQVLIDGHNIKRLPLKILRSHLGIVPQEVTLFNDTIKSNIAYGNPNASFAEIEQSAKEAHALTFIEKFPKKWKQLVGERGVKLSVGQKQRVAIARAVLRRPKILILDEPTSALDARSEEIIQKSLNKLMKDRTTFIIAHRISTVRKADLILVFDEGRITERGSHEELMKLAGGKYRQLYELQIGLHQ
ncbi:MAG: ABC transporter ATP-binding protein [Candidatus Paceibacterota bacterium]